jgi:translation initiation factor IF-2
VPVRIYALAKELNFDSKDLVDVVKKVGIANKESPLASLSNEEEQRVREHVAGAGQAEEPVSTQTPTLAAVRESVLPERKPKSISIGRSTGPRKTAKQDKEPARPQRAPVPLPPVEEKPPVEEVAAQAPEVRLPTGKRGGGLSSRMPSRGDDASKPVAPVRGDAAATNKVRSLDHAAGGEKRSAGGDASKPKRREPRINVKMAALPDAPAPAPTRTATGEKAQKPDIKLSKDVIAGHKQGMTAPLEQLKAEESESKKRVGKRGGLSGFTGEKPRRDKDEEEKPRRKSLAGMASARAERQRGNRRQGSLDRIAYPARDTTRRTLKRKGTNTAAPRKDAVVLELPCTVRSFCEAAGVPVNQVLRVLMGMQMMININSELELETAELIAAELDLTLELKQAETLEDELITDLEEQEDAPETLVTRPPIITFLGHVDHGKTSLLDYLIGIDVVSGEAGGITQHIRAYEVDKDGRSITFVDTPGHEAFTEMRARGANVTDIAVLVIAADDGIMPQTEEAISHAKAAEVPIIVALNKVDLEGVDINRTMTQLTEHQLTPSEWGGDVEVVKTSAIKGTGMDELLDTILTVAELNEYTANPDRSAIGVCLESEQQGDRGVVAKLVVQNGTLKVGDVLVCGPAHGRVRAMNDTLTGEPLKEAGPSTPVNLMGLDVAPGAGDRFHVLDDIGQAREIAESRADSSSRASLSGITTRVSFENFQEMLAGGRLGQTHDKVKLNLIIRADVKGSLEAIDKELAKFDHPEVELRVLQRSVGGVTLADATLASASDAVIIAFNVIPDEQARSLADERNVEIRRYEVIYKLTDDIKAMIEGRLKPEERVVELGRALVKQVFSISRVGTIAGCYVAQGSIQRGCRIRVNRDGRTIGDYALDSLKRIKEDVKEVPRGMECGIRLQGFNDVKQDDVLEAYRIEEFARTLD